MKDWIRRTGGTGRDNLPMGYVRSIWPPKDSEEGNCLLCNIPGKYKSEPAIDYICSRCVQLLLLANQQDLKTANSKAVEKGFTNKAKAIESFLMEDEIEQRKPTRYNQRTVDRKGTAGAIRDKKRIARLS
jgi:hypothetical protein